MIYEGIVKETIQQALRGLDGFLNEENAEDVIEKVDSWEDHKLLEKGRAYIVAKGYDKRQDKYIVKVFYVPYEHIEMNVQPIAINVSDILETVRKKCRKHLPEDSKYLDAPK